MGVADNNPTMVLVVEVVVVVVGMYLGSIHGDG